MHFIVKSYQLYIAGGEFSLLIGLLFNYKILTYTVYNFKNKFQHVVVDSFKKCD